MRSELKKGSGAGSTDKKSVGFFIFPYLLLSQNSTMQGVSFRTDEKVKSFEKGTHL
ncbi:hypothetical protein [Candidatus Formimonas warabiya]|uniref:hypothetical protein n=1 Tax=Formimonas warabiya TaxID=1761012 RepID=UPI001BE3DDBE|nr:hypothetical protein [Candidatus Formimonas warabiya]